MIFPTFQSVKFVEENGFLTSQMQLYNDELNNILRNGLSDNGWTVPQVTQAQLAAILALPSDQQLPRGTMWYVSEVPPSILAPYNELVMLMDDGTGAGTTLYKFTKSAYP
jgi:hypothetical protein